MNKTKLMDLIYDRLANNTENDMFEPEMAQDMTLVYDANTHEAEYIEIVIGDKQYCLTIKETNQDEDYRSQ